MNTIPPTLRSWPWGVIALSLSLLAWACLSGTLLAFAASFGSPGDGNHGMQVMQFWIVGGLLSLLLSFAGSLAAIVMAWRCRRGAICASIAGALLVMLLSLVLIVIGATRGPSLAASDTAIWQVTGSRG